MDILPVGNCFNAVQVSFVLHCLYLSFFMLNQMFAKKLASLGLFGFAFLVCCCLTHTSANELGAQVQNRSASVVQAYRSGIKTHSDFKLVGKFVKGAKSDKWRTIPWIPSLWDGVEASQARNKPMFIWAMNGDPLGCV